MSERTLFIIKPDAVSRGLTGQIIQRFESKGFTIINLKMLQFNRELATKFYNVHKEKPFFEELVSFITSGPAVAAIIEGDHAIDATRLMIGSTRSYEAQPGSVRGDFGLGISANIIHASDSLESFKYESGVVFS